MLTKRDTIGILLVCIEAMFLCYYVGLTSYRYIEPNLMMMLPTNNHSNNIIYTINSSYSKNKTNIKYGINHGKSIINQNIWAHWINDNKLSAIINPNWKFSEEEIQSLYAASGHYTAGALSRNLSVEILRILGNLVQEKIERNQNPEDCGNKKKLVMTIPSHGYGSVMMLNALALHEAVYAGRTLILRSKNIWSYSQEGWEKYHQPLSKNCTTIDPKASSGQYLNTTDSGKLILHLDWKDLKHPKVPAGIPRDIAPLLVAVHSRPTLWWHAQLIKYISRLQNWVKARVDTQRKELFNQGLVAPYVGVHIRRGDKVNAAAQFYSVKEYMKSVEEYFQTLAVNTEIYRAVKSDVNIDGLVSYNSSNQATVNSKHAVISDLTQTTSSVNSVDEHKKQIYLATDDDTAFTEMKILYPDYQIFVYTSNHSKSYGEDNLMEVIMDLVFLSEADFIVCTMSSNICSRALDFKEIAGYPDMMSNIHSLDLQYYSRIIPEFVRATEDIIGNKRKLSMIKGDVIKRNKWDWHQVRPLNMGMGYNERTNTQGVYPISKTSYYIKVADFPIFENRNRSRAESIIQQLTKELLQLLSIEI